jgi:hypothetical protein
LRRLEVTTARTLEEVEALRGYWQSFEAPSIEDDVDYFVETVQSAPSVIRPHVILFERDGQPEALTIGRVESAAVESTFGYRTVYRPNLRLLVVQNTIAHNESGSAARRLVRELNDSLSHREADAAQLRRLAPSSPLYSAARRMPPLLCRDHLVVSRMRWMLDLPDSLGALLASRSPHARSRVRTVESRLRKKYGERLSLRTVRAPEELDHHVPDLDSVARETYQRNLGGSVVEKVELERMIAFALDRGWFRAYLLYLDSEPIAYATGFVYNRVFTGAEIGYRPAYSGDRVGTFLLLRIIEDLCRDPAVDRLDYGPGDAEYKRRFSSIGSEEADVFIFAPIAHAIRVNLARTAISAATEAGRRTLKKTALYAPVKRRWRQMLSHQTQRLGHPAQGPHATKPSQRTAHRPLAQARRRSSDRSSRAPRGV